MLRMRSEVSHKDSDAQALVSAMLRAQQENTERLLQSHTSSTTAVVAGLMEKIEANMLTRDKRFELLASSQKAQADVAAASAAAQEMFMRQMQFIVSKVPTVLVASGSGGDDPPGNPQGGHSRADGYGDDKPARRATSLGRGICQASQDPDPDGGDDDSDEDDDDPGEDDITSKMTVPTIGTTRQTHAITRVRPTPFAPSAKDHLTEVTTTTAMETMTRTTVRAVVTPSVLAGQGVVA